VTLPETQAHLISISRIHVGHSEDTSILRLRGAVRVSTVEDFEARLAEAGHRSPRLVVNLSELEYLSSTGLGVLLVQARLQEQRGGWLRLVSPSPAVGMILRLTGVAETLPVLAGEAEAFDDPTPRVA
jgi:anti-anti-sigma factor